MLIKYLFSKFNLLNEFNKSLLLLLINVDLFNNFNIKAYNGSTPLHMTVANKNYLCTKLLLLESNASPYIETNELKKSKHARNRTFREMTIDQIVSTNLFTIS